MGIFFEAPCAKEFQRPEDIDGLSPTMCSHRAEGRKALCAYVEYFFVLGFKTHAHLATDGMPPDPHEELTPRQKKRHFCPFWHSVRTGCVRVQERRRAREALCARTGVSKGARSIVCSYRKRTVSHRTPHPQGKLPPQKAVTFVTFCVSFEKNTGVLSDKPRHFAVTSVIGGKK